MTNERESTQPQDDHTGDEPSETLDPVGDFSIPEDADLHVPEDDE